MRFSQVFSAIAASPFQTLQTPFGIGNQIFQFNGKAVLKKVEVLGIRVSPRCFSKSTTANPLQCIAAPLRLRVTPRKENKGFVRYLGGLFRSLFHHVANSVRERSLEHCTLGLQASKLHTHEFGPVRT